MIRILIPIRIYSEANISEHWSARHKRHKAYRKALVAFLRPHRVPSLPCIVRLTRIAPRGLDRDNLFAALKHPIDVVCDWLIPGLAPGRADGDKNITIQYSQEKGGSGVYALKLEISEILAEPSA